MKKASLGIGAAMAILIVLSIVISLNINGGITFVKAGPCVDNDGDGHGVCPDCGKKVPHKAGQPCYEVVCPKCGAQMIRE